MEKNLLDDFILNFETELADNEKINESELNQIITISLLLNGKILEEKIEAPTCKFIKKPRAFLHFYFNRNYTIDTLIDMIEKIFKDLNIEFKKHRFAGSLPFFSIQNNTIPNLLEGRGYSMLSFTDNGDKYILRLECLREYSIIKVLDGKLDNLTLVYWNGKNMSRSRFITKNDEGISEKHLSDESGLLNIELYSTLKRKNVKIVGEFSIAFNSDVILERILSVNQV